MRVLIAGTGSIGRRHIGNLQKLIPGCKFSLLRQGGVEDSFSLNLGARVFGSIEDALSIDVDLAVVATPSALHIDLLPGLITERIPAYVEKPIVTAPSHSEEVRAVLGNKREGLSGFNFRYLPSLQRARDMIRNGMIGNVVRASLVAGQWLPDWRPSANYRESYSASTVLGGGVHFDLVHELDVARWFFGDFEVVKAVCGKLSDLEVESPDTAVILLAKRGGGPLVSISLDYVSRQRVRRYEFVGDRGTLIWDLPAGLLELRTSAGAEVIALGENAFDTGQTYAYAMSALLEAVAGKRTFDELQGLEDGLRSSELAMKVGGMDTR